MGKGRGAGGAGSLRDLVETLYEDLFAYQTIKVVKTKDWRLGTMKRTFNAGVLIYVLFFMVLYHGYMEKEVPVVTVNTGVTDGPLQLMLANFTRIAYTPPYCYPDNTNYTYSATQDYSFNECADYYTPAEFTEKGFMSSWLYTYWQQNLYNRSCVPATTPPGTRLGQNFNLSNIPVCNLPYLVANANIFPLAAEYTLLTVTGTYTTSWGRTRSNVNATFKPSGTAGVTPLGINTSLNYPPGKQISFTYKQILDLAGIDLDTPNELNDGGFGPPWPIYRITGIELAIDMVYQNYIETLFPPDPFNFQDTLAAEVYPASKGTFRSPGTKLWYVGNDLSNPEATFFLRTPQGVLLSFSAAGSIGNPSFKAALTTLLGAVVLFGAATNLIDISAAFVIEGFREQKFEDGLDLRIRDMLRSQLSDVPTRAEIDEYELKRMQAVMVAEQEADAERERDQKQRERELKRARERQGGAALPDINGAEEGVQLAQQAVTDAIEDAQKRGITLDLATPKRAKSKRPLKGFKRGLEPRIARLIIAGEPHHGLTLTAQGFLENCRCVRFQWSRSRDGVKFLAIPGSTLPTFFADADDLGHIVRVEATPVTDDGYEGEPVTADTKPLSTRLNIRAQVRKLVEKARLPSPGVQGFLDVTDGLQVAGMRATMRISADEISCRTKTSIELGAIKTTECKVVLDRNDHCRMRIEDPEKMFFDVTFRNGEERDVYALTLRELSGDLLELRNAPEYMAGYSPSDEEEDEDED